jgi:hypothetical protein
MLLMCYLFSHVVMNSGSWPIRTNSEHRFENDGEVRDRARFRVLSQHYGVGSEECYVQSVNIVGPVGI